MANFSYAPIEAEHVRHGRNTFIEAPESRLLECFRDNCVDINWGKLDPAPCVERDSNRIPAVPSILWTRLFHRRAAKPPCPPFLRVDRDSVVGLMWARLKRSSCPSRSSNKLRLGTFCACSDSWSSTIRIEPLGP